MKQRRRIDEFFLGYRHQHLPSNSRWVIPLLDYMEEYLWSDTEAGGDIWNGRWTRDLLSSLLGDAALRKEEPRAFKQALQWLQKLTGVLQTAQRSLYRVRHLERQSQEAKLRRVATVASWKKRKTHVSQTLFAAWNLPYQRPLLPRRKQGTATLPPVLPPPTTQGKLAHSPRWLQFSDAKSSTSSLSILKHRPIKPRARNEHRTSKWKLRKLRNILLICQ